MAIVYLTSATGAPGVSTLATALTLHWPRPALLLEADTSTTSHLIPGTCRQRTSTLMASPTQPSPACEEI